MANYAARADVSEFTPQPHWRPVGSDDNSGPHIPERDGGGVDRPRTRLGGQARMRGMGMKEKS